MEKTSINTNVKELSDVQRALETIRTELDVVKKKLNPAPEKNEDETEGKTGSIRVIRNTDNEHLFEIKTEDGWKKPVVGDTLVTFKKISGNIKAPQKKSIDEIEVEDANTDSDNAKKVIFDEKADKFILARPDYDSGWVNVADTQTTGTHNLESIPIFQQIWWTDDDGVTVHRTYSSNNTSYTLELTTTGWQITGDDYYGYVCLSGTALTRIDYTGYKVKILLWK
jgi:hypothetical protein